MKVSRIPRLAAVAVSAFLLACTPAADNESSSQITSLGSEDYRRAEGFLAPNTAELISNNILAQYWQEGDQLVYRRSTAPGSEYLVANLVDQSKRVLFDRIQLAAAIALLTSQEVEAIDLTISSLELDADNELLYFDFENQNYQYNLVNNELQQLTASPPNEYLSPDGSKAAFIEEHNLWIRNTSTNVLTQLTFDGIENYGYATNNAGWLRGDGPVLLWSPDSTKIATFRHDGRPVREMYLYTTNVGHPELDAWKYPLPGDDDIFMIERVVIHLEPEPLLVQLNMPPDPHRSTTSDHVAGSGGLFLDVEWSHDSNDLAFVSSSRDHKIAQLRVANIETGAVRDAFTESVDTYFESGFSDANWRVLHDTNEFIWFSEQDNWGHLYLHDLDTGALRQRITSGNWSVLNVEKIDAAERKVYFTGANREEGDPYFHYLYRINFDGSDLELLTPESAHHVITWSDSGKYFTDSYSTPTQPATTIIRSSDGDRLMELEETDISALMASGWVAPVPFSVKARDQQTDLFGLMYRPSTIDESLSYPVLNYLYPGPQSGSVGSRAFRASRNDKQAIAELGFIVVEVDAMGTPGRSKSFHDAYYGNMGDNGLPDQIATIRQLAERHSYMDLERVGIWGHSGGGFASTAGILRYPDFYKVAVSGAGNHDNRNYEDDWGEKWQGLLETYPEANPSSGDGGETVLATNYDNQANQLLAANLQGELLLAHGMLDTNVHPSGTLLVVEALIEAEKDFDLVILPNAGHGFGNRRYFMKRRWDYFVQHLTASEAATEFRFADNIR
ncbi:MAG: prolyl oligopeptidase family serine peptidase [Pseudomonadales bacterium]|nr:prolyl oligopeptidase family serine peptidase [Pseudomonadales bacterium]